MLRKVLYYLLYRAMFTGQELGVTGYKKKLTKVVYFIFKLHFFSFVNLSLK